MDWQTYFFEYFLLLMKVLKRYSMYVWMLVASITISISFSKAHSNSLKTSSSLFSTIEENTNKVITDVKVFYNPVSSEISTTFNLRKQGNVLIKVMDALGSEVMNLMDAKLDEGVQSISFDTEGKLEAGIYFVRVSSGSETIVKRFSIR